MKIKKFALIVLVLILAVLAFVPAVALAAPAGQAPVSDQPVTADSLAALFGAFLSLVFSYVPGLSAWFKTLTGDQRRLVMIGMLLLLTVALFGLSCAGQGNYFTCTEPGAWSAFWIFATAAVANQTTYALTPGQSSNKFILVSPDQSIK